MKQPSDVDGQSAGRPIARILLLVRRGDEAGLRQLAEAGNNRAALRLVASPPLAVRVCAENPTSTPIHLAPVRRRHFNWLRRTAWRINMWVAVAVSRSSR